jgi:O-antigen ligase
VYGFITGTGGSQHMYGTNYIAETGLLAGHVALANNMNQMLPIAWFIFWGSENKVERAIAFSCLVVFLLALVGSGSRGGVLGLIFCILLIIWLSKQRIKMTIYAGIASALLLIYLGSNIFYTTSRINESSVDGRMIGLYHGVGLLLKGHILGVGPGCYSLARGSYFSYSMQAHNIYGEIIGDLGIPGIIAASLFIFSILKTISKIKKETEDENENNKFIHYLMLGIQVSLLTRLFISIASHGLYIYYWYFIAAIVISSQYILEKDSKNNYDDKSETKVSFFK